MIDEMYLSEIKTWMNMHPCVVRACIFGSRVKGSFRDDSDLDVGVEIELPNNYHDGKTIWWMDNKTILYNSLQGIIPYKLDLQLIDEDSMLMNTILANSQNIIILACDHNNFSGK